MDLLRNLFDHAGQIRLRDEREDEITAANLVGIEVDGSQAPRFSEHFQDMRADGRGAGIACLEMVKALFELALEAGRIDAIVAEDARGVVAADVQKLEEHMLNFNVVMCAGKAQAGGAFQGSAGGWV